jgi:ATP-dependent DNA helicase DinG
VDFQGETLRLVVVDKLPFPVPTEPMTEARCEAIKAAGGNDFSEYTIPVMTLVLKQALGRLIRHKTDKGVMAILDPRLRSKGYGKVIMRSLPDATDTEVLAEAEHYEPLVAA